MPNLRRRRMLILPPSGRPSDLRDTFTGTNGTGLQGHPLDTGQTWTVLQGAGEIQSNSLNSTTSGTGLMAVAGPTFADSSLSIDVTLPGSGSFAAGLLVRSETPNSGLAVIYSNDGGGTFITIYQLGGG